MSKQFPKFALVFIFFFGACSGQKADENNRNFSKGDYDFTMYDSANVKIVEGLLVVETLNTNESSGKYNFTKVITEFDGYGTMNNGKFTGKINQKEKNLLINTNPGQADRNVFFNIDIGKTPFSGTWYYTGFRNNSKPNKIKLTKK